MHKHTKSESEVTSLAPSSPHSPRTSRPLYFVQSPSRESHDDGDSKLSFHSTPVLSPIGSPLHHAAAFSTSSRSRDSSRSLASASRKSGFRKILPQPSAPSSSSSSHNLRSSKPWASHHVIHEEEPDFDTPPTKTPQIYTVLLVLLSCVVFLFIFIFLFWLICRPSHPQLSLKNIVFHNLILGSGSDSSGVPTKMATVNCTVEIDYYNPSKYFGVHVNPVEAVISLSELEIAHGEIPNYFQPKDTHKLIRVVVNAAKVPLYGAGNVLPNGNIGNQGVPFTMVATLPSQYYVVGKMIKPKYVNQIVCNIVVDPKTMALQTKLKTVCKQS